MIEAWGTLDNIALDRLKKSKNPILGSNLSKILDTNPKNLRLAHNFLPLASYQIIAFQS